MNAKENFEKFLSLLSNKQNVIVVDGMVPDMKIHKWIGHNSNVVFTIDNYDSDCNRYFYEFTEESFEKILFGNRELKLKSIDDDKEISFSLFRKINWE